MLAAIDYVLRGSQVTAVLMQVLKSPGSSEAQLDKAMAEVACTLAHNTADLEAWAVKAARWVVEGRKGGRGGCDRPSPGSLADGNARVNVAAVLSAAYAG
jgi:hypothetical protein